MSDVFRKVYSPLSDAQKDKMNVIKEIADILLNQMNDITIVHDQRYREFAIKDLESAVMWAIKAIT